MNYPFILSSVAIGLTIINTLIVIRNSEINKTSSGISKEITITSIVISLLWCVYGFIEMKHHVLIGYSVRSVLLIYLLYVYYKYS